MTKVSPNFFIYVLAGVKTKLKSKKEPAKKRKIPGKHMIHSDLNMASLLYKLDYVISVDFSVAIYVLLAFALFTDFCLETLSSF